MKDESKTNSTFLESSKSIFLLKQNEVIEKGSFELASTSTLRYLAREYYINENNEDVEDDEKIEQGTKLLAQDIGNRLKLKLSTAHFSFQATFVMQKELLSEIATIADRFDMQCVFVHPSRVIQSKYRHDGLTVGQHIKQLVTLLLSFKQSNGTNLNSSPEKQTESNNTALYLQFLLLLSRAPVSSLRKKLLDGNLSLQNVSRKNTVSVENNVQLSQRIQDQSLTEWNNNFSEEIDPNHDEIVHHVKSMRGKVQEEFNLMKDRKLCLAETEPSRFSNEIEKGGIISDGTLNHKPTNVSYERENFQNYGKEAIDKIENYIVIQPRNQKINTSSQTKIERKRIHNHHKMSEQYTSGHSLYSCRANALSYFLYNKSGVFPNFNNINRVPPVVAIISEVELCCALASALRGFPSSYFVHVTDHYNSNNALHINSRLNGKNKSESSYRDYPYWIIQANITDIWPITTSLSHDALHSMLSRVLHELADPISIIRDFCDFHESSTESMINDSCQYIGNKTLSYFSLSYICAAFRNCLQECILNPLEKQISDYETDIFKATSHINLIKKNFGHDKYELGSILAFTHKFASKWSKCLFETKQLIDGAFPSWRVWRNKRKIGQNKGCDNDDFNANCTRVCLDYLHARLCEENLLHTNSKEHINAMDEAHELKGAPNSSIVFSLFSSTLIAYCQLLDPWVIEGRLHDPANELFITKIFPQRDGNLSNGRGLLCEGYDSLNIELPWVELECIDDNYSDMKASMVFTMRKRKAAIPSFLSIAALDLFWCGIHIYIIRCAQKSSHALYEKKGKNKADEEKFIVEKNGQILAKGFHSISLLMGKDSEYRLKLIHHSHFEGNLSFLCKNVTRTNSLFETYGRSNFKDSHDEIYFEQAFNMESYDDICFKAHSLSAKKERLMHEGLFNSIPLCEPPPECSDRATNFEKLLNEAEDWNERKSLGTLLLRSLHLQCRAAGFELCRIFKDGVQNHKKSSSNFHLTEHLSVVQNLYCFSNFNLLDTFLVELFHSLDDVYSVKIEVEINQNIQSLRKPILVSPLFASPVRMTSFLRSSIESQASIYGLSSEKRSSGLNQENIAYEILSKVEVTNSTFKIDVGSDYSEPKRLLGNVTSFQTLTNLRGFDPMKVLENLKLNIAPRWPMKIILNDSILEKYNHIFSFLVQLNYGLHACKMSWMENRTNSNPIPRARLCLVSKVSHVVRCLHEFSMIATAGSSLNYFCSDQSEHVYASFENGLRGLLSKQNQGVDKMMKQCLQSPEDEILMTYIKNLLGSGIKIVLHVRKMQMFGDKELYKRCGQKIDEIEIDWNKNFRFLILALQQIQISSEERMNYEDLLIRLNFNYKV